MNADASALTGLADASGIAEVTNSTIKANNLSLSATGGDATNVIGFSYVRAKGNLNIQDSTLITDGGINFTGTAGTADVYAAISPEVSATVNVQDSTLTSGGNLVFTGLGGTANVYATASADCNATVRANDSTLTSVEDISFTGTGGTAYSSASGGATASAVAQDTAWGSTLTSGGSIIFTSTGGTATTEFFNALLMPILTQMTQH